MALLALFALLILNPHLSIAPQAPIFVNSHSLPYFDIQAHRGARGIAVENTLPAFAWGLISGASTLELDNGITKDGAVVVWHDNAISPSKCQDTSPAFFGDPDFPYVGKLIANLTLSQIQTLDCGSQRQIEFPHQLTYPNLRISTLQQVFDFVACVDPKHQILFNIESKVNAEAPWRTATADEFARRQYQVFRSSPYYSAITYQSFDWRTLIAMRNLDPAIQLSALIEERTVAQVNDEISPWLAGLPLHDVTGASLGARIANAALSIGTRVLSPEAPTSHGSWSREMRDMAQTARTHGMMLKPWTVNTLEVADDLMNFKVEGLITDYPDVVRRWAKHRGLLVAPSFPKRRALECLDAHIALQQSTLR